ncbi:MAG: GGDEF domain-containing phosphodiesterase [Lachnospiraceae bacterium]|nr:GGDEF domain-containing phosphodiesterase [Lachnospiraceae bacterium]
MSKRKEFKIKSLKRVNVVPSIIFVLLLSFFFFIAIVVLQFCFISMQFEDKVSVKHLDATRFASYIEKNITTIDDDLELAGTEFKDCEYVIYDAQKEIVASSKNTTFDRHDWDAFPLKSDYNFSLERNVQVSNVFGENETIDPLQFIDNYFEKNDHIHLFSSDPTYLNATACAFPGWLRLDLLDGEYTLYYRLEAVFTNRDMNNLLLVTIFSAILVAIPMIIYIISTIVNIVHQTKARRIFYLDTVTGGKNWVYFTQHADKLLKHTRRNPNKNYVLISLRMDKYQNYCLCYGGKEGEDLVERFASIIKKQKLVRKKELFARYTEAEFGFLLQYSSEYETEIRIQTIKNYLLACAFGRKIDFSAGICEAGQEILSSNLYGNARIARSNLAAEAPSKIAWYNEKLRNDQLWEQYVESHMEEALANGEFQMYIQPKYAASTRTLGGGEALIRWVSPKEGIISPIRFIPIFEKNGFITKIDDFMIRTLAEHQAKWIAEGRTVVPISVNVSRAHFARPDLAEHICEIVDATGAPKDVIELELTESAFFQDREVLIGTVSKLREYGFKVSMDDFGADYSSLNSLKDMPMDVIKLDAGFFRGKSENEERGSLIVAGIIDLAKQLDMHIVAEGIEHVEQVDFLAEHGCDLIQGYYFAKPMPVTDYETLTTPNT